ncbi:LytR/AlgR family response regulator transcription factor [Alkalicoccobacillus murimartini]|uniref:Two-component system LytT family response regulator n=1 Tax=Alkalicoccobacillus murimartini TaxID=171685 RepID=A0ABT9YI61_9BACI|nr:LytTR family DNA-binding domain-containing protein [Alkalicoccobacillus murimartini]MDQ0206892.1 two-component system LytT family response regulator [Alkalicoccobacillus murimartini]
MKAIIVEDEMPAQKELQYLIDTHSHIEVVGCFDDGLDVLKYLQDHEPDAIFLDINVPSLDGMMLASHIRKFETKPAIIFTTAYKEHAAKAFELEAFDYILKPYSEKRVAAMLTKLEAHFSRNQQEDAILNGKANPSLTGRINVWKDEKIYVIDEDDIYYAEANEKQTTVYTKDEVYTILSTISIFQSQVPEDVFYRCHRSYIVNVTKIHEIVPWFHNTYLLRLQNLDAEIPVSRGKAKEFRQMMRL